MSRRSKRLGCLSGRNEREREARMVRAEEDFKTDDATVPTRGGGFAFLSGSVSVGIPTLSLWHLVHVTPYSMHHG